ncbi:MAG: hypothetical protein A3G75_00790 [Verrucomicrobia bacterium RIFCSPLOWO2_12_FULL_64_8]|nr:MAG: hypothetical protein A3G75_00790 [Verrucomicrobia bacterium RIFCSPLOWO2_12_FULL_64_8]
MTMEFGWWARDEEGRKFQIRARIFGGNIVWASKHGHHQPWGAYGPPTDEDWAKLVAEAERRVPRRLLSSKQLEAIKRLRPQ